jgi:hypothetical protein
MRIAHVLLVSLLLLPSAHGDDPAKKAQTAEEIGREWIYKSEKKGKEARSAGMGAVPPGSTKLYAYSCLTTYGSYADAWNFYAGKCGTDLKYKPNNIYVGGKKIKAGEYIVMDQSLTGALFTYRTEEYVVCVTLTETKEKEVLFTVTVSVK